MLLYWLLKPLLFILTHTPRRVLRFIGKSLAAAVWAFSEKRRKVAIINAKILGAKNPKETARKSYDYIFTAYMETLYAPRINKKFIDKHVTVEGLEIYENMRKQTGDMIFVGGHFGPWSMLATIVHQAVGLKFVTIGRSTKNKALDRILDELRNFEGVRYLTHRGAMEKLPACMAEGYYPGVYIDHTAMPKDCVNAPFFNYKVPVIAGIPALAARKNYPIIFFFGVYEGDNIRVIIDGPVIPDKTLKPKERIYKLTCDINAHYEKIYSKYPEQWYLIHRRFKRIELDDGTISDKLYDELSI